MMKIGFFDPKKCSHDDNILEAFKILGVDRIQSFLDIDMITPGDEIYAPHEVALSVVRNIHGRGGRFCNYKDEAQFKRINRERSHPKLNAPALARRVVEYWPYARLYPDTAINIYWKYRVSPRRQGLTPELRCEIKKYMGIINDGK